MYNTTREYRVSVLIHGRFPAPEVEFGNNTYIEGFEGSDYELLLENLSPRRIEVLTTIDGLSTLNGKPASERDRGYVVPARQQMKIPGWLVDQSTAAKFKFKKVDEGEVYAQQIDSGTGTGVIGFMIFREKIKLPPKSYRMATSGLGLRGMGSGHLMNSTLSAKGSGDARGMFGSSAPAVSVNVSDSSTFTSSVDTELESELGTGWGEAQSFDTHKENFEREHESIPNSVLELYYDSTKNLEKMGIPMAGFKRAGTRTRSGFPASPTYSNSYTGATPPPGWRKK